MSRIRGPYVRFCERDEAKASPYSMLHMGKMQVKLETLKLNIALIEIIIYVSIN